MIDLSPTPEAESKLADRGWRRDNRTLRQTGAYQLEAARIAEVAPRRPGGAARIQFANKGEFPIYPHSGVFHACAASAVAAAIELRLRNRAAPEFHPSVRFLYYVGRYLQCREGINNGASIYATLRAAQVIGFCSEGNCPLSDLFADEPSAAAYAEAQNYGVLEFNSIAREQIKAFLANDYPVVFGILVDRTFVENDQSTVGVIIQNPPPNADIVDRHTLLAVGYDDARNCYIARDSIGDARGDGGYIEVAYDYVHDATRCDDFWTIRDVADQGLNFSALQDKRTAYVAQAQKISAMVTQALGTSPQHGVMAPQPVRRPPIEDLIDPHPATSIS